MTDGADGAAGATACIPPGVAGWPIPAANWYHAGMMKRRLPVQLGAVALAFSCGAFAQTSQLFDGDFESGTFQGWIPGGDNGGFASIAARGSCYSGNDTSAITFNGNDTSNYAALLRSNAAGNPDSVARLRSQPFTAGNGVIFSALSETLDGDPGHHPVEFGVNIIDASGNTVAELPYRTAVIQLSQGCPSEPRDAAFSQHFIDTHHFAGQEISIEFTQHTRFDGLGYFTLIDNVLYLDQGQFVLNSGQPIAVAGTGLTRSGTFFLDPRATVDPDNGPLELSYRWFIDGEDSIREIDIPCVNLNEDFNLEAGNNTATLYVSDGFHYAADTIRFVIPDGTVTSGSVEDAELNQDGNLDEGEEDDVDDDTGDTDTDTSDTGDDVDGGTDPLAGATLTDPLDECDVDLSAVIVDDDGSGGQGGGTDGNSRPVISVEAEQIDYSLADGDPVFIADSVTISDADDDIIESVTISISNNQPGDSLSLDAAVGIAVAGSGSSSIILRQADSNDPASAEDFAAAVEDIEYDYNVPAGEDAVVTNRNITYVANDGTDNSETAQSVVDVMQ